MDYFDRTSTESPQAPFTDTYPLSARKRHVELEVRIKHPWQPDWATTAYVEWYGSVKLERATTGKGKR